MRYFATTEQDLEAARPGLALMEKLTNNLPIDVYLYGITSKADVLYLAHETLVDYIEDEDEAEATRNSAPDFNGIEIAVAIQLGDDPLQYLSGSGWKLTAEEFAYRAGSDDVRTQWFPASGNAKITFGDFTAMAVADSDTWLDEFLKEHGTKVAPEPTVTREDVPAVAPPAEAQAGRAVASKKVARRPLSLNSIDNFLA